MSEEQSSKISVESMRKNILTLLLKRMDIVVTDTYPEMTKEIVCTDHSECLYSMQLAILKEAECKLPESDILPSLINDTLKMALDDLVSLGLSKKGEGKAKMVAGDHTTLLHTGAYQITPKGLDVALKLQEHDDNERRFGQQKAISETLKTNSTRSLYTAWGALIISCTLVVFGAIRIHQLDQKISSHTTMEKRINTTDIELGKLRGKNDLLVKELEALKNKPVNTVIVKVDDTHQTKKKER